MVELLFLEQIGHDDEVDSLELNGRDVESLAVFVKDFERDMHKRLPRVGLGVVRAADNHDIMPLAKHRRKLPKGLGTRVIGEQNDVFALAIEQRCEAFSQAFVVLFEIHINALSRNCCNIGSFLAHKVGSSASMSRRACSEWQKNAKSLMRRNSLS